MRYYIVLLLASAALATPPLAKQQNKRGLALGDAAWDLTAYSPLARNAHYNLRTSGLGLKSGLSLYSNFGSYADGFDYAYPGGHAAKVIGKEVQVPIAVPQPVPYEVTKYVAVPHPVPYKVDRPYPVPVPQPVPVEVTRHVPVKVDRPYPVPVPYEVKVPHAVPIPVSSDIDYSGYLDSLASFRSNFGFNGVAVKKW